MILYGASGHAKVILDILYANGVSVEAIWDDHPRTLDIFGIPVKQISESFSFERGLISIGNNKIRKVISERYSAEYPVAVHRSAVVASTAKIGNGTVIMAAAVVNPDAEIGRHCIINSGAVVEHDCILDDFVHISPNASLAGNVKVGEGAHIGIGASIIQGISIGAWATVGAGSVVIKDVPAGATVVGVPAQIIKSVTGK